MFSGKNSQSGGKEDVYVLAYNTWVDIFYGVFDFLGFLMQVTVQQPETRCRN
ncbi:hypothetical protein HanRHA438_Chr01g0025461 [Helianthus annuus]|nr:hypothetical protein HanRHA438_Chr01g0025461 [Helianthus annuus]